jgi:two-component system, chemotaxis family, protein-glutamate methylesterase/glutaminase
METMRVIALAASAGGLQALREVLGALPADLRAALVIVQHLDPNHVSMLAEILSRDTKLKVRQAAEGDRLRPSTAFIAPPDCHLLLNTDTTLSLSHTKLVHFVRPSADLLFESVAASCGDAAIAVVLSGTGQDGAMGVRAIKKMGGTVIVQDPAEAAFRGMPEATLNTGVVDHILPLADIAPRLTALLAARAA